MSPSFDPFHLWRDPRVDRVLEGLDVIQDQLADLTREQTTMSELVDELRAAVEAQQETVLSVVTLLGNLTNAVEDNVEDPEALLGIIEDVRANTRELADAVMTYTPPEGEEPGSEEPTDEEPPGGYEPPDSGYEGDVIPPPDGGGDGGGDTTIDFDTSA